MNDIMQVTHRTEAPSPFHYYANSHLFVITYSITSLRAEDNTPSARNLVDIRGDFHGIQAHPKGRKSGCKLREVRVMEF